MGLIQTRGMGRHITLRHLAKLAHVQYIVRALLLSSVRQLMVDYVHLALHSEFSLVDGVVRVSDLLDKAVKMQMPAVALTDQSNVFAMVKFYRTSIKQGIKPIIGADVCVGESKEDTNPTRLSLLCANTEGFRNLSRLLTLGYIEGTQHAQTMLLKEWFKPDSLEGLIALSGGQFGEVGRALLSAKPDNASKVLDEWTTRFPDRFYIEPVSYTHLTLPTTPYV